MKNKFIITIFALLLSGCSFYFSFDNQDEVNNSGVDSKNKEVLDAVSSAESSTTSESDSTPISPIQEVKLIEDKLSEVVKDVLRDIKLPNFSVRFDDMFRTDKLDDNSYLVYSDKENQLDPLQNGLDMGFVFLIKNHTGVSDAIQKALQQTPFLDEESSTDFNYFHDLVSPEHEINWYLKNRVIVDKKSKGFKNNFSSEHTQRTLFIPYYDSLLEITLLAQTKDYELYEEYLYQVLNDLTYYHYQEMNSQPIEDTLIELDQTKYLSYNTYSTEICTDCPRPRETFINKSVIARIEDDKIEIIKEFPTGFGSLEYTIYQDLLYVHNRYGGPEGGTSDYFILDSNGDQKLLITNHSPWDKTFKIIDENNNERIVSYVDETPECPVVTNWDTELIETSISKIAINEQVVFELENPIVAQCTIIDYGLKPSMFLSNFQENTINFAIGNVYNPSTQIQLNFEDPNNLKFKTLEDSFN